MLRDEDPSETAAHAGRQVVSAGASFLTLEMLKGLGRPGAEYYWEQYQNQWPLAWKSGTSFGQRDAWAAGVSPQWTLGVWVGDFQGGQNANLRSSSVAAPILFDVFNRLPKAAGPRWFDVRPSELRVQRVCVDSGYAATDLCEETSWVAVPGDAAYLQADRYHRRVHLTLDGSYRVDSRCWEAGNVKSVTRMVLPARVSAVLSSRGAAGASLPPFHPRCVGGANESLAITYPPADAKLWVPLDLGGREQRITLRAVHQQEDATLHWYLNDAYHGASRALSRASTDAAHSIAPSLAPGAYRVVVVDGSGNRHESRFEVVVARGAASARGTPRGRGPRV